MRVLLLLCLVWGQAWGATWYVRRALDDDRTSLTYGTGAGTSYANAWAGCAAISGTSAGDTIELDTAEIWYERCVIDESGTAGSYLTVRGSGGGTAQFEHTVPIDGAASFSGTTTWANTGYAWSQVAGTNVWKKTMETFPYQATEDGNLLTGVNCYADDESTAVGKLSPGTFCKRNTNPDTFYYYPTTGVVTDHAVRVSAHNDDANPALFYVNGSQYLNLSGLSLKYHRVNSIALPNTGGLGLLSPDYINISDVTSQYNFDGIAIDSGTNITIASTVNASYNMGSGVTVEGLTDNGTTGVTNLTMSATANYNGRAFAYDTDNGYQSNTDGDGYGIGYLGGFGVNIQIVDAESCYNGSPDNDGDQGGAGVIVSTADANTGFEVHVLRSKICYNHGNAFNAGDDWRFGDFIGNLVYENCRGGCDSTAQALTFRNTHASFAPFTVAHNNIFNNYGSQSVYLFNTTLANVFTVANNIIKNTTADYGVSTFNAELHIGTAQASVVEAGNNILSSNTSKALKYGATTYTQAQITGGTWDAVGTTFGELTTSVSPGWVGGDSAVTSAAQRLTSSSALRRAGKDLNIGNVQDCANRAFMHPPSIGACEATSGDAAAARTAR
jgi:hypothetical protein